MRRGPSVPALKLGLPIAAHGVDVCLSRAVKEECEGADEDEDGEGESFDVGGRQDGDGRLVGDAAQAVRGGSCVCVREHASLDFMQMVELGWACALGV